MIISFKRHYNLVNINFITMHFNVSHWYYTKYSSGEVGINFHMQEISTVVQLWGFV